MIVPVIIPGIEITNIKTNRKNIFKQHIEIIHSTQANFNQTTGVVHRNFIDKVFKYNLQMQQFQIIQVLTTSKLQYYN